jgi:exodeoxyribonuclease VII large subunit
VYFTLKDEQAVVNAVIWRTTARDLQFELRDGQHVLVYGNPEIYPARGQLQFIVRRIAPRGEGALQLAFRQLCARLEREGLFERERKRSIPAYPKRVAVITSAAGAALRDFLEVCQRRWRAAHVVVVPALVQGERAPAELVRGLVLAHRIRADVAVLIRGGGSIEDLWAFNDEALARAIFHCPIPVVTGVGHEVDVTIADLVADLRALTPSEAAERVFPERDALNARLRQLEDRLSPSGARRIENGRRSLAALAGAACFRDPLRIVRNRAQTLDRLGAGLTANMRRLLELASARLDGPQQALEALSPVRVLQRGYAYARLAETGELLQSVRSAPVGSSVVVQLADGRLRMRVEGVELGEGTANDERT